MDAPGRVPAYLTGLIGREAELEQLLELLGSVRLLTLTGSGGSGKTRLAAALAQQVEAATAARAWWVDLSELTDPELVADQALRAVGGQELPARGAVEAVARTLGGPVMLVLDNCEQVALACAELTGALLRACPELTLVATSRTPLAVPGEQVFRVGGLSIDAAGELFIERGRRHGASIGTDEGGIATVREICHLLDGVPLAIELAASRTPLLTVGEISTRLARDTRLLRGGTGGVPDRQRSLDATLAWSHQLLAPREQAVFRRLGAFRGTFAADAAEGVVADDGVEPGDVLDALGALVHQSLIEVAQTSRGARYRLLLAVRRYAEERLEQSGEAEAVRGRHAAWCLALLAEAEVGLLGADQVSWLERLEDEHENLRAALSWGMARDVETAGELASRLWQFWYRRGHYHEGRRWLEEAVRATRAMTPAVRASLLAAAGAFAHLQCEYRLASKRLNGALRAYRALGDESGTAATLQRLGSVAREQGRYARSIALHEQSLELWERLGDGAGIADSIHYLGFASWLSGDLERAAELTAQSLERYEALGEPQEAAAAKVNVGVVAHYRGDDARAAVLLDQAMALARACGYQEGLAWALHERGVVAVDAYELTLAAELLVEGLRLHSALDDQWRAVRVVEDISGALLAPADPSLAAALLEAAAATRERLGAPVPRVERAAQQRYLRALRRSLAGRELEAARARGRAMTLSDAAAEGSAAVHRLYLSGAAGRNPLGGLLTPRERAVLQLVSEGRTNREIGLALSISTSTVGVHVSNTLRKLNVARRVEAVARAQRLGLIGDPA